MAASPQESPFGITLNLKNRDTLDFLRENDYRLYVFRGLKDSTSKVAPLIMLVNEVNSMNISLKIADSGYLGYISLQQLLEGKQIFISRPITPRQGRWMPSRPPNIISNSSIAISSNQKMVIDQWGNLSVKNVAVDNSIQIQNNASQVFTTGMGWTIEDRHIPFCGQPIMGGQTLTLEPLNVFLLVFSNNDDYKEGTYLKTIDNRGMLIKTSVQQVRTITYDIAQGWENNDAPWGKQVPTETSLNEVLINASF